MEDSIAVRKCAISQPTIVVRTEGLVAIEDPSLGDSLGTRESREPLHMASDRATERGLLPGHRMAASRSHEISVNLELRDTFGLKEAINAMH